MKFRYKARNQGGDFQEGIVEASNSSNASNLLQRHNLVVVSIAPEKGSRVLSAVMQLWEGVSAKDFVMFSRQLAVMIEAKVPLMTAVKGIIEQTDNPFLARVLTEVLSDIDEGKALSESLRKHPNVFSEIYVDMVQSGEVSGNLQKSLEDLANNIEKNYTLSQKVKGVLYYPVFIISAFILVAFLMLAFVIPKLMVIIKETNAKLPITTKMLIASGDFMSQYWWAVLFAMIMGVVSLMYYMRTEDGKKEFDVIKLKIPIINKVLRYVYLARFAENLSTLVRSGLPIVSALEISARVVGNAVFKDYIMEAAEKVKRGGSIADVFSKKKDFPSVMIQMIRVGEETGRLDSTLVVMSNFYNREADQIVSNLSSIVEPILIVILGVGVGILVFSIIVPIYNVAQGIR